MILLIRIKDLVRRIQLINRESWRVKVKMVITHRYLICTDVDDTVEFIKVRNDAVDTFHIKLFSLYYAMLEHDYSDCGKIRPERRKRCSNKMYDLWKIANQNLKEKKLLTL